MAISNIHETLLMYTKQKALINDKLTTNMMDSLNASKQVAENQAKYNDKINEIYYNLNSNIKECDDDGINRD